MLAAVVDPPLWIELPAVVVGALAGALFAQRRGLDIVGILALALVGAFFAQPARRLGLAMYVVDAVSLALFCVIGAQGGLTARLPIPSAIFLWAVTGVGGSVLRDVLVGETSPRMLRRGPPYATAALAGATVYVGLVAALDARSGWRSSWP